MSKQTYLIFIEKHLMSVCDMIDVCCDLRMSYLDLSDDSDFSITRRKRTDIELDELKKQWDEEGHLRSGESYIDMIKDDIITEPNMEYPTNFIKYLTETIGKYDIIFVGYNRKVIEYIAENRRIFKTGNNSLKTILIYPDHELFYEYIGRMYVNNTDAFVITSYIRNREKITERYIKDSTLLDIGHALKPGEKITEIILNTIINMNNDKNI